MDVLISDSFRTEVIRLAQRGRPRLGAIVVLDDTSVLRFSPVGEIMSRVSSFDTAIMSAAVAALIARRMNIEISGLPGAFGSTQVRVATERSAALSDRGGDAWVDLVTPSAVEDAVTEVLEARLPASAAVLEGAPALRFGEPVGLSGLYDGTGACGLCGAEPRSRVVREPGRQSTVGAAHNLGWLRRRTLRAADNPHAIEAATQLLEWKGAAHVVASGGSAVAATYIAQVLREHGNLFAAQTFPSDYVATASRTEALVLVSFSGNTPDHVPVIRRARQLGVERIALICQSHKPRLARELPPGGLVVPYGNARRPGRSERGFVSMAATVAPCALMLAAARGNATLAPLSGPTRGTSHLGRVLGEGLASGRDVHVLATGYARPAMLDLESKWVEGDLGPITIHQSKDFSHGRFMSLLGSGRPALPVMLSVEPDLYEDELIAALLREHEESAGTVARPQRVMTDHTGLLGGLELLMNVQEAAADAARYVGRDLSRPERIDPGGLRLYAWETPATTVPTEPGLLSRPYRPH